MIGKVALIIDVDQLLNASPRRRRWHFKAYLATANTIGADPGNAGRRCADMSGLGHTRRFREVCEMTGLPPTPDISLRAAKLRSGPEPDILAHE